MSQLSQLNKPPILIGGCPRSGTTLLLSVLSAHPSILAIHDELWGFWPTETREEFSEMMGNFYARLEKRIEKIPIPSTCTRWCEKTPNNVREFDKLGRWFEPTPKLIHIVRDGRDVVTSKHPSKASQYWVPVEQWVWEVTKGLECEDHPQVVTLRYEDLVTDFENTVKELCVFLEEDPERSLMAWYEHTAIRANPAWPHEVRPLSTGSIGRWKDEQHKEVTEAFMKSREAVKLMKHLRYLA